MKRTVLIILLGLSALVLAGVAALGIFLSTFDPNAYKEQISDLAEGQLGRPVRFEGDLAVSFFPSPSLKVGRISLPDSAVFGDNVLVGVEGATLTLSLDHFLTGTLVVEELTLHGARVGLVTNALGRHNWQPRDSQQGDPAQPPTAPGVSPIGPGPTPTIPLDAVNAAGTSRTNSGKAENRARELQFSLMALRCNGITVTYRDLRGGPAWTAEVDSFSLNGMREIGKTAMPIAFSGRVRQDASGAAWEFAIQADIRRDADEALVAEVREAGIKGRPDGWPSFAANGSGRLSYTKTTRCPLRLDNGSASLLLADEESAKRGPARIDVSRLSGCFAPGQDAIQDTLQGAIAIEELDLDCFPTDSVPVSDEPEVVAVRGAPNLTRPTVAKPRLDPQVIRTMEAVTRERLRRQDGQEGASQAGAGREGWRDQRKERGFSLIRKLDASLSISAKKVLFRQLPLENLSSTMALADGVVTAPYEVDLFRGNVTGRAIVSTSGAVPDFSLSADVAGLDLAEATKVLSGKYSIGGLAEGSLFVTGRGTTSGQMLRDLSGKGVIRTGRGEIRGFSLIPGDLPGLKPVPLDIPFDALSASVLIRQGHASSRDLSLRSTVVSARGSGTMDLASGRLDLGLDFLVGGLPPAVPVSIGGRPGSLSISVDMPHFLRNLGETALPGPEEAVRGLLRNVGGALLR